MGKTPCESCHTQGPTKCAPARPSFQKRMYKVVKSWSSWKAVCCSPQMHSRYHLACAALSKVTALLPAISTKKDFYTMKSSRSWNAVLDRRVLEFAEFP